MMETLPIVNKMNTRRTNRTVVVSCIVAIIVTNVSCWTASTSCVDAFFVANHQNVVVRRIRNADRRRVRPSSPSSSSSSSSAAAAATTLRHSTSISPRRRRRQYSHRGRNSDSSTFLSVASGNEDDYYDEYDFTEQTQQQQTSQQRQQKQHRSNLGGAEFGTALAIVPDTADWDRIQRARHYANDPVFLSFPPCIRLFHPFQLSSTTATSSSTKSTTTSTTERASFDDQAFDVAQLIEDFDIEPFEISFDTWSIIPLLEVWEEEYKNNFLDPNEKTETAAFMRESDSEREVRELIERETEIADRKAEKRREKIKKKKKQLEEEATGSEAEESTDHHNNFPSNSEDDAGADEDRVLPLNAQQRAMLESSDDENGGGGGCDDGDGLGQEKSAKEIRQEQQNQLSDDEFGGSCVLCLEPDEESKAKLEDLREALREGLGHDPYSSPSSVYAWKYTSDEVDSGIYRPLIPISKFDSFPAAMDVARRLKGLWGGPLTLNIRDLHLISCYSNDDAYESLDYKYESGMYPNTILLSTKDKRDSHHAAALSSADLGGVLQNQNFQRLSVESKDEVWGCNAKIKLMGEEVEQDDEVNSDMIEMLLNEGQPGGADKMSDDFTVLDDVGDSISDIEQYLDDDDFDEGARIVVGRVHFYTGERRIYQGMPASSVVDARDRSMGENGMISGAARRRGSISRQYEQLKEGEFGRRDRDFLPWGLHERTKKENDKKKSVGKMLDVHVDVDDSA